MTPSRMTTTMGFADYLRELAYPLRSIPIVLTAFTVFVIVGFIAATAIINPWVAAGLTFVFGIFLLPGFMRYLMHIAESRAKDLEPEPPTVEMFSFIGNFWALSPLPVIVLFALAWHWLDQQFGSAWATVSAIAFASVFPAMLAVLVVTNSAIQSLNPIAISRLIVASGLPYWYAPLTASVAIILPSSVYQHAPLTSVVFQLYLLFAFFAVTGSILRRGRLIDELALPDVAEPSVEQQIANLEKERTGVLNHAYGFASRGNREGGLQHIYNWLDQDQDPAAAWLWFFEQMLRWEETDHALYFAQNYLSRLLAKDEQVPAVKLMLRCRLVNDSFKPKSENMPQAIDAAEQCGNHELADLLKRL